MGFTIMESFMDDVKVESSLGFGTRVIMRKKIESVMDKKDLKIEKDKEIKKDEENNKYKIINGNGEAL